jgi:hypothetical protein
MIPPRHVQNPSVILIHFSICEGSDGFYFFQKPKRRRSSAQPVLGGATTKKTVPPAQLTVIEVSEPEEEELPAKKVGRTKKLVRVHFVVI